MQEFIEKLIGRLEEERNKQQYLFNNVLNNDNQRMVHAYAEQCYLYMTDIVNQLAEEHNNGWIACSERLPKFDQEVLLSADDSSVYQGVMKNGGFSVWEEGWIDIKHVLAWQPLLAPYQQKA